MALAPNAFSLLREVNTKATHEHEAVCVLHIVKERLVMPWTHMTLTHLTSKMATDTFDLIDLKDGFLKE